MKKYAITKLRSMVSKKNQKPYIIATLYSLDEAQEEFPIFSEADNLPDGFEQLPVSKLHLGEIHPIPMKVIRAGFDNSVVTQFSDEFEEDTEEAE